MHSIDRASILLEQLQPLQPNPTAAAATADKVATNYYNIDDLLTKEERDLRNTVRKFVSEEVASSIEAYEERAQFPFALLPKFAKLRIWGGDIQGYGCPALSGIATCLGPMELARASTGLGTWYLLQQISMCSIFKCGSEAQKQRWLPKMASLQAVGAFALTEPNAGSDAAGLQTSARPVPGGFVLNGEKRWIGNASWADVVVVWARNTQTGQINGFVVEKGAAGMSSTIIENKIALRVVQNGHITFKECFVPEDQRLVHAKDFQTGPAAALFLTRIMAGWIALGTCQRAFEKSLAYVKSRTQFGKPLASFQIIQARLVQMLANLEAMTLMLWRTAKLYDAKTVSFGQVGLCKAYCTQRAREIVQMAREVVGGNGIVRDFGVATAFTDIEATYTFEGSYDINTLICGREITGSAAFK